MEYKLNAQLVPNVLTPEQGDFVISVIHAGKVGPKEIINAIVEDGIEVSAATMLNVITRYQAKTIQFAGMGYDVNDGQVYIRASVRNATRRKAWNREDNPVRFTVIQGSGLHKAAAETTVNILGLKSEVIEIISITDMSKQQTDGTITRGRVAELKGSYIKIAGDNPAIGITFKFAGSGDVVKLPAEDIVINEPSRILFQVPLSMPTGEFTLTVTTQYSSGGKLLKEPRSATAPLPIIIG